MDLPSFAIAPPAPALQHLVRNYWRIDARHLGSLARDDLMPIEGGSGWILVIDGQLDFATGSCSHGGVFDASTGTSNRLLGVDQADVIGIRFQPGAQARFSQLPATEYLNTHIPLAGAGVATQAILKSLNITNCWQDRVSLLDQWLLGLVQAPTERHTVLQSVVNLILERSTPLPISTLCQASGWSERYLQRHFSSEVGLSTQRLGKIARANVALRAIKRGSHNRINLSHVAIDHGYFDHAHMTRDFRQLFGIAPSSLITPPTLSARPPELS
ncbi:AraC family transcriptional regulator [Marinobacter sp. SS21]|uniref:AraC family transcriptional regulator n=1 Tax=Marinobacter sp. SS21 TaxID=2979460 RepID=UPI00232C7773|nr:AraC family transcriptional regulator [Marinobacter sp. SS21]MDC0661398.1 helix-turn-helix domain-containing protein [Marinobacter sp. SS21]